MESYISITLNNKKKTIKSLAEYFNKVSECSRNDLPTISDEFWQEITDDDNIEKLSNDIWNNDTWSDYYLSIQNITEKTNAIEVNFIAGSGGFEFGIQLTKLFGALGVLNTGTYEDDEEPSEEGWPLIITYNDHQVFVNGKKYLGNTNDDEEDDWDVGPKIEDRYLAELRAAVNVKNIDLGISCLLLKDIFPLITKLYDQFSDEMEEKRPSDTLLEELSNVGNVLQERERQYIEKMLVEKIKYNFSRFIDCNYLGSIVSDYKITLATIAFICNADRENTFQEDVIEEIEEVSFECLYATAGLYLTADEIDEDEDEDEATIN